MILYYLSKIEYILKIQKNLWSMNLDGAALINFAMLIFVLNKFIRKS